MDKLKVITIIIVVLSIASVSRAGFIIYADDNGPNVPGTGTFNDPFRRIQDAIDAANAGDVVEIRPGIYTADPNNYNLDPKGKSITIRSIDPNNSNIVAKTIIDPNGAGRGFYIHSGEDANCIISGLTIKNAYTKVEISYHGAGIYCYNCNPTISNCVIQDGNAEGSGGGICFDYSSATVINCIIRGNTAGVFGHGGGISCRFSSPKIIGCTISNNTAGFEGGGIDSGMSDPIILNCVIVDNNAPMGGGINCYFPGVARVVNCTIAGNSADIVGGAVHCWSQGSAIIENSILWANSAIDGTQIAIEEQGTASAAYSDMQYGQTAIYDPCELLVWGSGNIDIDPCFASFEPDSDPNLWDFHLKSIYGRWNSTFYKIDFNEDGIINLFDFAELSEVWLQGGNLPEDLDYSNMVDWADLGLFTQYYLENSLEDGWVTDASTSPCVDSGDPNFSWTAESWPNGKRINMGAFGGTGQASKNGNLADFDVNGAVNLFDLMDFCSQWLDEQGGIVNLDLTGCVDFRDFAIFAENWLWQRE